MNDQLGQQILQTIQDFQQQELKEHSNTKAILSTKIDSIANAMQALSNNITTSYKNETKNQTRELKSKFDDIKNVLYARSREIKDSLDKINSSFNNIKSNNSSQIDNLLQSIKDTLGTSSHSTSTVNGTTVTTKNTITTRLNQIQDLLKDINTSVSNIKDKFGKTYSTKRDKTGKITHIPDTLLGLVKDDSTQSGYFLVEIASHTDLIQKDIRKITQTQLPHIATLLRNIRNNVGKGNQGGVQQSSKQNTQDVVNYLFASMLNQSWLSKLSNNKIFSGFYNVTDWINTTTGQNKWSRKHPFQAMARAGYSSWAGSHPVAGTALSLVGDMGKAGLTLLNPLLKIGQGILGAVSGLFQFEKAKQELIQLLVLLGIAYIPKIWNALKEHFGIKTKNMNLPTNTSTIPSIIASARGINVPSKLEPSLLKSQGSTSYLQLGEKLNETGYVNQVPTVSLASLGLRGNIDPKRIDNKTGKISGNTLPYIAKENASYVQALDKYLADRGYTVTYTSAMGGHKKGTAHYLGKKLDFQLTKGGVPVQLIDEEVKDLTEAGFFSNKVNKAGKIIGAQGWEKHPEQVGGGHYDASVDEANMNYSSKVLQAYIRFVEDERKREQKQQEIKNQEDQKQKENNIISRDEKKKTQAETIGSISMSTPSGNDAFFDSLIKYSNIQGSFA